MVAEKDIESVTTGKVACLQVSVKLRWKNTEPYLILQSDPVEERDPKIDLISQSNLNKRVTKNLREHSSNCPQQNLLSGETTGLKASRTSQFSHPFSWEWEQKMKS